jgi:hypothetical protein
VNAGPNTGLDEAYVHGDDCDQAIDSSAMYSEEHYPCAQIYKKIPPDLSEEQDFRRDLWKLELGHLLGQGVAMKQCPVGQ